MDFTTVQAYCRTKFDADYDLLPFSDKVEVNKQYLQEKQQSGDSFDDSHSLILLFPL